MIHLKSAGKKVSNLITIHKQLHTSLIFTENSGTMKWRVFSSIPTTYQSAGIKHIGIKKKTKDSAVMDGINVLVTGLDSVHPTMTKKVIHSIKKSAE